MPKSVYFLIEYGVCQHIKFSVKWNSIFFSNGCQTDSSGLLFYHIRNSTSSILVVYPPIKFSVFPFSPFFAMMQLFRFKIYQITFCFVDTPHIYFRLSPGAYTNQIFYFFFSPFSPN